MRSRRWVINAKMPAEADNQNFEELMSHTNVLNRKLEEVYGVGKEFTTAADLWGVSLSH